MLKRVFILFIFSFFLLSSVSFAQELSLVQGKTYLMNFDDEILSINMDKSALDAEIIYTIFNGNNQIILSLKNDNGGKLQIKTSNNFYNYDVKKADVASNILLEIDMPPVENLDVDIWNGE